VSHEYLTCLANSNHYLTFERGAAQLRAELVAAHLVSAAADAEAREAEAADAERASAVAAARAAATVAVAAAIKAAEEGKGWKRAFPKPKADDLAAALAATAQDGSAAQEVLAAARRRAAQQVRFFHLNPHVDRPDYAFEVSHWGADPLDAEQRTLLFFAATASSENDGGEGRCVGAGGTRLPYLQSNFPSRVEHLLRVAHHLGSEQGGMGPAPLQLQHTHLEEKPGPPLARNRAEFEPREPTAEEKAQTEMHMKEMHEHIEKQQAARDAKEEAARQRQQRLMMMTQQKQEQEQKRAEPADEFEGMDFDEL
jgi:hypothetical protein